MLKSELLSWPLTLVLLVFAFGTLVAAGLPLLLTMAGLLGAGGLLFVFGQFADVSIWAMNFAMMFAIALGIDYALFIVVRFRSALAAGLAPREATAVTMATAGKAVLVSGLTVIAALLALTLVPVPAFRTVPIGIGLAVTDGARRDPDAAAGGALAPRPPDQRRPRAHARRDRSPQRALRRRGAPACGRGRFPTAPRPSRSCCSLAAPALGLRTGMPTAAALAGDADSREGQALLRARVRGTAPPSALQIVVRERGRGAPRGRRSSATGASPRSRRRSARTATCCSPRSPSRRRRPG